MSSLWDSDNIFYAFFYNHINPSDLLGAAMNLTHEEAEILKDFEEGRLFPSVTDKEILQKFIDGASEFGKKEQKMQFALCLDNEGYKASLEVGKLYQIIPDKEADAHGYVRITDESGEDYAFSANRFHVIRLPVYVEKTLSSALQAA